jgi:predicted ATPase
MSRVQSVLSQVRAPDEYPEVTYLGKTFDQIKLYREWSIGRDAMPRAPQKTDLPEDFLEESTRNLGAVLNDLEHRGSTKHTMLDHLKTLYEDVEDYSTKVQGGTIQIYFAEKGLDERVPATRLSDGTLRFLSLLAVLCHPTPPPLICIEEPELGLHPDIVPTIAELLIDASTRTQLMVTTHSDQLVSALSETPDSVLVCERGIMGTAIRRLDADRLEKWLRKYSLGELWQMGELGGVRW